MAGVHIVIDSAAVIPSGALQDYSVSIVPQKVSVGDSGFHGGTDAADDGLLDLLRHVQARPRIESAPVAEFRETFARILDWGVEIISLHAPQCSSDSVDAAREAAGSLPKGSPVSVVELPLLGPALGLAVLRAAQAGIDDHPREAILDLLQTLARRIELRIASADPAHAARIGGLPIGVDDLEPESAVRPRGAGPHPIYRLRDGALALEGVASDVGAALRQMASSAIVSLPEGCDWHLAACHADAEAEAAAMATYLDARRPALEAWVAGCDPITACLLGPGAFGLAWYREG